LVDGLVFSLSENVSTLSTLDVRANSRLSSIGNGWAAAGMLRVLATIKNSNLADQFQSEQTDLKNWVVEILDGMYRHRVSVVSPSFLFPRAPAYPQTS
jgi:hypothetical protein